MAGWFKDGNPLTRGTQALYIARPEGQLNQLIYKHPDKSIPRGAKLTVRASECALFFREGRLVGRIDPGTVQLDTANFPFLGHLIVDPLTAGNHFLTELFFISTNEIRSGPLPVSLGQYRDLNSGNVVIIRGSIYYTLLVTDPESLVVNLAGQGPEAQNNIVQVLHGRLLNHLKQIVGRQAQSRGILDIVSNADAEDVGAQLRKVTQEEFSTRGIAVGRLLELDLSLDEESLGLLREFGRREADLAIDLKGAEIATREGFAQFNFVKGQRAAMQGLGAGLATGNSPMVFSGASLGGAFQPPPGASAGRSTAPPPRAPGGQVLSTQSSYLIVDAAGERGPYTARQVALMAISGGRALSQVMIRRTDDPPDMTFTADLEPPIAAEVQRRAPPGPGR